MEAYNLNTVIENAIDYAESKLSAGKLIACNVDYDFDDKENYKDGDPETVYSISSLYGQFITEEDTKLLEAALLAKYPTFI